MCHLSAIRHLLTLFNKNKGEFEFHLQLFAKTATAVSLIQNSIHSNNIPFRSEWMMDANSLHAIVWMYVLLVFIDLMLCSRGVSRRFRRVWRKVEKWKLICQG